MAAEELDIFVGAVNTVILLISSMTIAMSTTAFRKETKALHFYCCGITLVLGICFFGKQIF
jgi:cytochrome c oxidase subunit III